MDFPIFTIDRDAGKITVVLGPETMRYIARHLPSHDGITYEWKAQLAALEQAMGGNNGRRCPGSGQNGEPNGGLLMCPVCQRLIGAWPPQTLPEHNSPIYDDGKEPI